MIGFLTVRWKSSGYQLWVCQIGTFNIREGTYSSSTSFTTLWSKQIEGIHIGSCDTISVKEHLCQDCWGRASKSNNLEAYLTALKQTSLFMVSSSIFGIFCRKLEGTTYSEESFCCQDSQSALQLRFPGKCLAVIVISYPSRNCLISFEICISSWFFVPPIFSK